MNVRYRSTLPSLFALLMFLAACSPKYGAHFAPSGHAPEVAKAVKKSDAPVFAEAPQDLPLMVAERAKAAAASEASTDAVIPAVGPTVAVAPKEVSAKEQRKMLRSLKDKLKGMSQQEKEAFKQQVLHQLQEQQLSMQMADAAEMEQREVNNIDPVVLVIVTILIPPLGVYLHQGEINSKFWISLVLTLLFYLPGLVYSLLVIFDVV